MPGRQKKSSVPTFIRKLVDMLQSGEWNAIIRWDSSGTSICVLSVPRLESLVLPTFFRHSKFASFVRQLNMYGFSKCKAERGVASAFSHPHFTSASINYQAIHKNTQKGTTNTPTSHQNVSNPQQDNQVKEQLKDEVPNVGVVGSNSLQFTSAELTSPNHQLLQEPQINELLGDLEDFLDHREEEDLLWSWQIMGLLNEPRYRRIKGNILDLWQIEGDKNEPSYMAPLKMEFIL